MKTRIGSYEAKTQLPRLLREVRAGKSFTITSRGEAIADLVPSERVSTADRISAIERIKTFMKSDPVKEANVRALIQEGRA
jgi:prevent-host-death family protein